MPSKKLTKPSDYIESVNMNGLKGRMLHVPAPKAKKRELLFIYGHHSSLERWWGVIQDLNQYGAVTMVDLPGFGGMQSYYKIGKKPTIDNLADYLASFIKLRYKRKKVTILGLSFGFVVATRMLQKYPELVNKVDILISVVGFASHDDFIFSKPRLFTYKLLTKIFTTRPAAILFKNIALNPGVLRTIYHRTRNAKHKFGDLSKDEHKAMMDFEIHLWQSNDVRTHMFTSYEFLGFDNCSKGRVDIPLWHIAVKNDNYFDNHRVEQHLNVIFNKVNVVFAELKNHAPSIIADKKTAEPMIPKKVRSLLNK